MVLLALLVPVAMLGVLLALGRYEELIFAPPAPRSRPIRRLITVHSFMAREEGDEK
jgi:hypothetical protein